MNLKNNNNLRVHNCNARKGCNNDEDKILSPIQVLERLMKTMRTRQK